MSSEKNVVRLRFGEVEKLAVPVREMKEFVAQLFGLKVPLVLISITYEGKSYHQFSTDQPMKYPIEISIVPSKSPKERVKSRIIEIVNLSGSAPDNLFQYSELDVKDNESVLPTLSNFVQDICKLDYMSWDRPTQVHLWDHDEVKQYFRRIGCPPPTRDLTGTELLAMDKEMIAEWCDPKSSDIIYLAIKLLWLYLKKDQYWYRNI